ncbi:cysteine peptidase family C39 domain-containing protein [Arenibacterium sp. CAU 1754]
MLRSSFFWFRAIWTLLRNRRHFVMQTGRTDCGVASALTVLNMLGRKSDAVHAVDHMDADRTGTTLDALRRFFEEQHGFAATALSVPAARLHKIKGHIILHMQQQHYVVLLRQTARGVLVFDPAMGVVFYPRADFASLYSGFLLEIQPRHRSAPVTTLPALPAVQKIVGGNPRRGLEGAALFMIGLASRLLECALLLCLVAALFLVLNHASFPSLLTVFGLVVVCGGLLLVARQTRFEGEDKWVRRKQSRLWRGLLRTSLRGRDLNGFRGRFEKDVSGALRRGMIVSMPQHSQIPAALGSLLGLSGLLCLLNPIVAGVHLTLFAALLVITQLNDIQLCRVSVRPGIGRYSKMGQRYSLISGAIAPDLFGELAKWSVIGFAGFSVLLANLPPAALMFWILTAMQLVPIDFRRVQVVSPLLGAQAPVSELLAVEVPLRRQKVVGEVAVKVAQQDNQLRIDGIAPLTATLQQPDLTVREQRLIMADVVRLAIDNMPEQDRPQLGPIRIFGPGQDASQADFEHLMIAQETRSGETLPVLRDTRKVMDLGLKDPVLRDLHSCAPGDFPVFWDYRGRIPVADIQKRLSDTGLTHAGHLTMKRLTVVKAA